MKPKILIGALALLIAMNVAAITAFLVVQVRHPRPPLEWRKNDRSDLLGAGLSREKRRRIMQTMGSFHEQSRGLIDATRALEDSAITAMGETPVPRARIDSLLERISANRLELARRATHGIIAMEASMTSDERKQVMRFLVRMRDLRTPRVSRHDPDTTHAPQARPSP